MALMATLERTGNDNRFGGPATIEDLELLPDGDGQRYELIEGDIFLMSTPVEWHQDVAYRLLLQLGPHCEERGFAVRDNTGILLADETSMFIPDVVVYRTGCERLRGRYLAPADVAMAVEIVSRSSRRHDREVKPSVLSREGIAFYLLVDPFPPPVHVTLFALVEGAYEVVKRVEAGTPLHIPAPFDLVLDTSKLG